MTTPIPTPFDIIEPLPGAFVPSGTMWLILALGGAALFIAAKCVTRHRPHHSMSALLDSLLSELNHMRSQVASPQDLERSARIIRRILSPYLPYDTAGLSSQEMRSLAITLREKNDAVASSVGEILPLVADIEDYAYAPSSNQALLNAQATLHSLFDLLEAHVRRHRPQ